MGSANSLQFYRDQAEQAHQDAEAATLSNVKDRCRRSEAAWTMLADRVAAAEKKRQEQALQKAAELLA